MWRGRLEVLDLDVTFVALLWLVGGPQGKVISQQLHNEGGILV